MVNKTFVISHLVEEHEMGLFLGILGLGWSLRQALHTYENPTSFDHKNLLTLSLGQFLDHVSDIGRSLLDNGNINLPRSLHALSGSCKSLWFRLSGFYLDVDNTGGRFIQITHRVSKEVPRKENIRNMSIQTMKEGTMS